LLVPPQAFASFTRLLLRDAGFPAGCGATRKCRFIRYPLAAFRPCAKLGLEAPAKTALERENAMTWTTPTLVEICIGLEINGYLQAEF
jgi:coenzyme PQQ precursor peptide PqqA